MYVWESFYFVCFLTFCFKIIIGAQEVAKNNVQRGLVDPSPHFPPKQEMALVQLTEPIQISVVLHARLCVCTQHMCMCTHMYVCEYMHVCSSTHCLLMCAFMKPPPQSRDRLFCHKLRYVPLTATHTIPALTGSSAAINLFSISTPLLS